MDVGPLGPAGPDGRPPDWLDGATPLELARLAHLGDLGGYRAWLAAAGEIRARWEQETAASAGVPPMVLCDGPVIEPRGTPVWTADQAEPVMWIPGPAPAPDPGRPGSGSGVGISGLITAVSGLQNSLQAGGLMDYGGPPAERLARPSDVAGLSRAARWPARAAVLAAAVTALFAVAAVLAPPGPVAIAAAAIVAAYATAAAALRAWRWPSRQAGLYGAPPLTPPAASRYAAARARYIATGSPADLAEMERHVEATPGDGGPAWAPGEGWPP